MTDRESPKAVHISWEHKTGHLHLSALAVLIIIALALVSVWSVVESSPAVAPLRQAGTRVEFEPAYREVDEGQVFAAALYVRHGERVFARSF